jgi:serine/threonine-protein kinase
LALTDWEELEATSQSGGQGVVKKVIHRESRAIGALKQLHEDNEGKKERRFRFLNEVSALRVLAGDGAPRVLDADESQWGNPDGQLYLVMEWVQGPTLSQKVNACKATIDEGKNAIARISYILEGCHALPIYHRDIKPNNIVMRGDDWGDPVLVDFGMSWLKPGENPGEFKTPKGQEVGNRFLRLPEHTAGGDQHDSRSDVCMAVGLLFFMLTGRAPRSLDDGHGLRPHQLHRGAFPSSIVNDPRWPRLMRLFNVGFQYRMEARIQNAGDLRNWLESLDDDAMSTTYDELAEELARLNDTLASAEARRVEETRPTLDRANRRFFEGFQQIITGADLEAGGQGPIFLDRGLVSRFHLSVHRKNTPSPNVFIEHRLVLEQETLSASFRLDQYLSGTGEWETYYFGPAADDEGLMLAMTGNVRKVAAKVIRSLREKWE